MFMVRSFRVLERIGRRDVTRMALEAEPLQGSPKPIGERTVGIEIDLVAERCLTLHALTRDRDRCASARELALPLAQEISAAEIADDLGQHIAPPARPRAALIGLDKMRFAVGDAAALLWPVLGDSTAI
jgi:hypothetical protein